MIINTTKRNALVLVFSMDVMKKSISSKLRENLGIIKGKKMMKIYKSIIKVLEEELIIKQDESDEVIMNVEFTNEQSDMAKEFISTYTNLIEEKAKEEGQDIEKNVWYTPLQNFVYALLIAEKEEAVMCEGNMVLS